LFFVERAFKRGYEEVEVLEMEVVFHIRAVSRREKHRLRRIQ